MSETRKDGGAAFPYTVTMPAGITGGGSGTGVHKGLSLRDWFAGQAIAGMMAAPYTPGAVWDAYALDAYAMADALLRAREKE